MLTWNVFEIVFSRHGFGRGRATAVGAASGAVVGLVAITPGCAYVDPMFATFIGFFTSGVVFFVPEFMRWLGADDRLDCFAVHGVGGMVGSALTGLFANGAYGSPDPSNVLGNPAWVAAPFGSFYGNAVLLGKQCASISVTILFAAVGTSVIYCFVWVVAYAFGESPAIAPHKQENVDAKLHRAAAYSRRDAMLPGLALVPVSPNMVGMPSPSPVVFSAAIAPEDGARNMPALDLGVSLVAVADKPAASAPAAAAAASKA